MNSDSTLFERGDIMFVGREKELGILDETFKTCGKAVLIYGKRKVGKTTLIRQYLGKSSARSVYFECIKSSLEENITALTAELVREGVAPSIVAFSSLTDMFIYLNSLNVELTIAIDEYPYMKLSNNPAYVDSVFQNIIDNRLSNINLILSGSHVSMMKELMEEGNSLYGRFSAVIALKELSYIEAAGFYQEKSAYEKIAFYSIFGGSPFINKQLNPKESLKKNIIKTILNENSNVYIYADNVLLSDYSNRINVEKICHALGNEKKRYGEIEKFLRIERNGNLHKQLQVLMDMELIRKINPINRPDDPKKTMYDISDNLLRFYFKYIYRNKSALQVLGPEVFYEEYIDFDLTTFIAHRFEEICRDFFSMKASAKEISGVRNIGTLYYDDSANKKNGEFDVAIQYKDGFAIYEVKYHKKKMTRSEITAEINQINNIRGLDIIKTGFISANGFEWLDGKYEFFTGKDIYFEDLSQS